MQAAALVAEDTRTDVEIAAAVGVSRETLAVWKRHPGFAARVDEHIETLRQALEAKGIADKRNRIAAMQRRSEKLWRVIEARAADPQMANVAGGETGLFVRNVKWVKQYTVVRQAGQTEDSPDPEDLTGILEDDEGDLIVPAGMVLVSEYAIDDTVLNGLLKLERAVALEKGELTEKRELTGKDGAPLAAQQVIVYLPDNGRDARTP